LLLYTGNTKALDTSGTLCPVIQANLTSGKYDNFISRAKTNMTNRLNRISAKIDTMLRIPEDIRTQLKKIATAMYTAHNSSFDTLITTLKAAQCPIDQTTLQTLHDTFVSNFSSVKTEMQTLVTMLETDLGTTCPAGEAILKAMQTDLNEAADNLKAMYDDLKSTYASIPSMTNDQLKEYLVKLAENTSVYFSFLYDEMLTDVFHMERAAIACVN
jgi:hypothetical protein